ncbi:MAG TPA: type II toxin-antitoxin system VapC family toxin [Solirubrobacteraceae bacterium]|nr:type II toxin-antitoxin system VapC family toxin [Solirubrobacteraceae bacterium]
MRRFLFDTSVFLYAVGSEHEYREPCRAIISAQGEGELAGEASVELIHEFAYVRSSRSTERRAAARSALDVTEICPLHEVTQTDVERALELWCEHERLDMRDAIFAAQALNRGIDAILSPDRDFDGIEGLHRIDPGDADAVASLEAR